jgi:hypothetical protein
MFRSCPFRPAAGILAALIALSIAGCGKESAMEPEVTPTISNPAHDDNPAPTGPDASAAVHRHKMIVALEMPDFESASRLADRTRGMDAFLYGHIGAYEDQVRGLEGRGLESFRYFNVMTTDPLYPTWGGYYAELHAFLVSKNGWIPGVAYPFFSDPRNPDRIIDHTRTSVATGVAQIIRRWADRVGADRVFMDLAYDQLEDWMIRPTDHWPWPASQHAAMQARWRQGMTSLVRDGGAPGRVVVNGSPNLPAAVVLYENEVWNDRRGYRSWEEVVRRIRSGSAIPAVHVGHHYLTSGQAWFGELMTAAVWLLADDSYLLVEPEGRALTWAREIQAKGYQRFLASEPIREVRPGVFARNGTIDGAPWRVEVDLVNKVGRVVPLSH